MSVYKALDTFQEGEREALPKKRVKDGVPKSERAMKAREVFRVSTHSLDRERLPLAKRDMD